jgi:NADPH2:quinone reductase
MLRRTPVTDEEGHVNATIPATHLQMRSLLRPDGVLELSLVRCETPRPAEDEVLIRVGAAPINPSDIGLLFAGADVGRAVQAGTTEEPRITLALSAAALQALAARVGQSLPVGNEGAGVVVAAGAAPEAQALIGRTVACFGGGMYAQYRCIKAAQCLALPPGTAPAEGASCFVNPLTALGMVETMRREGHRALVHTAAASNLGQMLQKICLADGIPLVNIVRRPEQAALLRDLGATHVCDSSAPGFAAELLEAVAATGATLAFDAVGGGPLADQILAAMEGAALRSASGYNRYGSSVHKQVYVYGALDRGVTPLSRNFGMCWSVGGWLLPLFLQKIGPEAAARLRARVAAEIRTTFASRYDRVVSLAGALQLAEIAVYGRQATGHKYLIDPGAERLASTGT